MSTQGFPYGMPGQDTLLQTTENAFLVGDVARYQLWPIVLDAAAVDAGMTPTYELRGGLLLGRITATGLWKQYDPAATDGSQTAVGVLYRPRRMQDYYGNTAARMGQMVIGGYVRAAALFGLDEKARRDLFPRFVFDDLFPGTPLDWKGPVAKATDYTVTVADNGTHFTTRGAAGTVNFTLPAIGVGRRYRFSSEAAGAMTVTAPANKLVTFNNLTATSVAFSTAGNIIGASVEVVSNDSGSKYIALPHGSGTMTVA